MLFTIFLLFLALIFLIILNNIGSVSTNANANANTSIANQTVNSCTDTHFGCCPDGLNSKINIFGSNCNGYKF